MQYLCLFILVTRACLHCLLYHEHRKCSDYIKGLMHMSAVGSWVFCSVRDWEVVQRLANYTLACAGIATMLCTPTVYVTCLDASAGFS